MMKITILIFVSLINNVFGEECESCCIPDVEKYSRCYKGCLEECKVDCDGTKFGAKGNSYWQYTGNELDFLKPPKYTININITLEFSTKEANGLIFFGGNDVTADKVTSRDFISLIIKDGFVSAHLMTHYSFGVGTTVTVAKYDDGSFHIASVKQTGDLIDLCVDHICTQGSNTRKAPSGLNHNNGLFWFGGVPDSRKSQVVNSLSESSIGLTDITEFKGCIRNIVVDGNNIASPALDFNTE